MFSRPTRQQQQKGVISVLAAVALGAAIVVAALAVDLGHVFWVKRDLQKAADLASLSAVTNLSQATDHRTKHRLGEQLRLAQQRVTP